MIAVIFHTRTTYYGSIIDKHNNTSGVNVEKEVADMRIAADFVQHIAKNQGVC